MQVGSAALLSAWLWIVPPTMATVGQVADGVSTYRATHGYTRVSCVEVNSLYGSAKPSGERIIAMKVTPVVASWVVAWFARRNPSSKTLQMINWATASGVVTTGMVPAVHNILSCGW